jgi:pyruvate dehydrogenase (quinone)
VVDPAEIPTMPHIEIGQAWKFGMAKVREAWAHLTGGEVA